MSKTAKPLEPLICPFVVTIDTSEQLPWPMTELAPINEDIEVIALAVSRMQGGSEDSNDLRLLAEAFLRMETELPPQSKPDPFEFKGVKSRLTQSKRPFVVPTEIKSLMTGDYSISGLHDFISIERKADDLYPTILANRDRFERELARMQEIGEQGFACVICEHQWQNGPLRRATESDGEFAERAPRQFRSVLGSIRSWRMEFPKVHWIECASRRQAEVECFRCLELFWRRREREMKEASKESAKLAESIFDTI